MGEKVPGTRFLLKTLGRIEFGILSGHLPRKFKIAGKTALGNTHAAACVICFAEAGTETFVNLVR